MNVQFGWPAAAALLIALPLILAWHMRRFRHPRVVVAAVAPWRRLLSRPATRRHRIPRTLLLALHLLGAGLLAVAATDPRAPGSSPLTRAVVVDAGLGASGPEVWSAVVNEATAALGTGGELTLVAAGRTPRVLVGRTADSTLARAALARLQPQGSAADLAEAVGMAREAAGANAEVVVVAPGEPPGGLADVEWRGVPAAELPDVAITRAAAAPGRLFAHVANFGVGEAARSLSVVAGGTTLRSTGLTLAPRGGVDLTWSLPGDVVAAELRLDGEDPFPLDDRAGFVARPSPLRIQLVGESPTLERALAALGSTAVERVGRATYFTDGRADLTVFVGGAPDVLPPGGVLVVAPREGDVFTAGPGGDLVELQAVQDHPLTRGLDFSDALASASARLDVPAWAEPIVLGFGSGGASRAEPARGVPAAFAGVTADSRVVVLGFDLDGPDGNVALRPALPALIARVAAWAGGERDVQDVAAGDLVALPPGTYRIEGPNGDAKVAGVKADGLEVPGLYRAAGQGPAPREIPIGVVASAASPGRRPPRTAPRSAGPGAAGTAPGRTWVRLLAIAALGVILAEELLRARATARER